MRRPTTSLFAEIDPQQKERIVRALQRTGHSVGYLGDGINDAPALHAADVGISVDQAVDVARESADIILLKRDLDVLRTGVEDGRRTFANTLKYISITTSANFGNMVSMALAAPLLPFLPLVAKQILLNNFLSDVPSMAISTDRVDAERVTHPQRWDITQVRRYMIVFGLVSSVFDLLTFAALLLLFRAGEATFQTTWFVVSLLTELGVVLVLRTRGPAWRSRPSCPPALDDGRGHGVRPRRPVLRARVAGCSASCRSRPSRWAPSSASSPPTWRRPRRPSAGSSAPEARRPPDDSDRQPRRAASIVAMSIFFIVIIASKARLASAPPAASASVSARGVICQERPQRSLHQPHALSWPPLPTIAFQ